MAVHYGFYFRLLGDKADGAVFRQFNEGSGGDLQTCPGLTALDEAHAKRLLLNQVEQIGQLDVDGFLQRHKILPAGSQKKRTPGGNRRRAERAGSCKGSVLFDGMSPVVKAGAVSGVQSEKVTSSIRSDVP